MTYICFFFVLYCFALVLKFGTLPSKNPRCVTDTHSGRNKNAYRIDCNRL